MLKPADPEPSRPESGDERPIGDFVHQLIEDGKAYARAELEVVKAIAADKGKALGVPAAMLGGALLFAQAAVVMLAAAVCIGLALFIGPLFGAILSFFLFGGIAAALARVAIQRAKRDL